MEISGGGGEGVGGMGGGKVSGGEAGGGSDGSGGIGGGGVGGADGIVGGDEGDGMGQINLPRPILRIPSLNPHCSNLFWSLT
jgi:hypothetical protein